MPETEELRVVLRTVADTSGAKQTQQTLRGIQTQALSLAAAGSGLLLLTQAIEGFVNFLGDSITALREHERALRLSSAAYATMHTEVTNLDAAYVRAGKSGNEFQVAIGRLAAPAALLGIKAIGTTLEDVGGNLRDLSRAAANLAKDHPWLLQAAAGLPGIGPTVAAFGAAGQGLQTEERALARRRQEQANRRLREINELPATTMAQEAGRLAFWDQVDAAVRDAVQAQKQQVDLQRESVDLAAQEAAMRLSLLPAQSRMLELQRQMTEQQIRAQQAALPATEALEDLRYLQRRAELITRNRNVAGEERSAARRQLRAIGRAEPGVELAALDAERGVTVTGRAATRFGLEAQLFEISTERQLAQIEQATMTNQLLSTIAGQRTQAIELTINLSSEEFQTEVFKQLIEATDQAQGPTVVKLSGVRR